MFLYSPLIPRPSYQSTATQRNLTLFGSSVPISPFSPSGNSCLGNPFLTTQSLVSSTVKFPQKQSHKGMWCDYMWKDAISTHNCKAGFASTGWQEVLLSPPLPGWFCTEQGVLWTMHTSPFQLHHTLPSHVSCN